MMPTLVLHIGPHKTGSTYIQRRLFDNRAALATLDIEYPNIGIVQFGHHLVAEHAQHRRAAQLRAVLEPLRSSAVSTTILSSENFDRLEVEEAKLLREELPRDRAIQIVYFTRDCTDLLVSSWQEGVKHGDFTSFFEFVEPHLSRPYSSPLMNHEIVLQNYQKAFENAQITVLDYDRCFQSGDIFDYFCDAVGLPAMRGIGHAFTTNISMPAWEIELIRTLNAIAYNEGLLRFSNIREAWLRIKKAGAVSELLEPIRNRIIKEVRPFSIRGCSVEKLVTSHFNKRYRELVFQIPGPSRAEYKMHDIPLGSWQFSVPAHRALSSVYQLVVEELKADHNAMTT